MRRSRESENTRVVAYMLYSAYRNKDEPLKRIEQFWPLPTDDLEAIEKQEKEVGDRLEEKLKAFKKKYMSNG